MPREKPEKVEPVNIIGFQLLNEAKVRRAIETLEKFGSSYTQEQILAEYDKLGGAIKKEGRIITMGTFYDFLEKKPKKIENYKNIGEESYDDEYVLVRKKRSPEKKLSHKELSAKIKALKPTELSGEEPVRRGRPRKNEEEG